MAPRHPYDGYLGRTRTVKKNERDGTDLPREQPRVSTALYGSYGLLPLFDLEVLSPRLSIILISVLRILLKSSQMQCIIQVPGKNFFVNNRK